MEYLSTAAFLRLTGRAFFTPSGATSQIDLGNCDMVSLDLGIKRKQHFLHVNGKQLLNRDDAYGSEAKYKIDIDEFVTSNLPLLAAATAANADVTQTSATAATIIVTSKKGQTFNIGKYNLANASVTTPTSKTEGIGADYVIDRVKGKIYFPLGSSIADATSVTITYDAALVVFDSVTALTQLNSPGTLEVQTQDDGANAPREIYTFTCNLSLDSWGDTKVDDYRKVSFIATSTTGTYGYLSRKT